MNVSPISPAVPSAPTQFNAAAIRNATPAAQRTAVASQFEAVLVRQLLGSTLSSMLGGSEGGTSGSVYGDLLADSLAQQLSAGRGLGLGRFIEQQLTPKGEKPSTPESDSRPATTHAARLNSNPSTHE
jgi:Rod binding domain-containing protein